jgi:ABC-2 type transport system permease protein
LRALLEKELRWSKHNAAALLVLVLVLPATFGYASVAFQTVIPQDAPVAVVATEDGVDDGGLAAVDLAASAFAEPVRYESEAAAIRGLHREEIYAMVTVPPGLFNESTETELELSVDGSMVLFEEPSRAMVNVLNYRLDSAPIGDVSVQHRIVGESHTLAEYLIPILLIGTLMLFAFTYVPYNLASESRAIERIRTESSLESLITAKLAYFTALMLIPIGVFGFVTWALGYTITPASIGLVAVLLLSFVAMTAVAMTIMLVTRFGTAGRFVCVIVMFGLLSFGGIIYPAGFFSPLRRSIVRSVPLHYTTIVTRGEMLRDVPLDLYTDYLLIIGGTTLAALLALKLGIVAYRRGD